MMERVIIDVRENDEFSAEHIRGSTSVPLSRFNEIAPGVLEGLRDKRLLIICRSGNRAELAKKQIQQLGFGSEVDAEVYLGGILEWKKQGKPEVTRKKLILPIMRQVQLIAGVLILTSVILGFLVDQRLTWIAAFVG